MDVCCIMVAPRQRPTTDRTSMSPAAPHWIAIVVTTIRSVRACIFALNLPCPVEVIATRDWSGFPVENLTVGAGGFGIGAASLPGIGSFFLGGRYNSDIWTDAVDVFTCGNGVRLHFSIMLLRLAAGQGP